jgi:hypothetical protein
MRKGWATTDFVLKLAVTPAPLALLALQALRMPRGGPGGFERRRQDGNHLVLHLVKCHNSDDWAEGVAMDTSTWARSVTIRKSGKRPSARRPPHAPRLHPAVLKPT